MFWLKILQCIILFMGTIVISAIVDACLYVLQVKSDETV